MTLDYGTTPLLDVCGQSRVMCARAPLRVSLAGGGTDLPSYYRRDGGQVVALSIDRYVVTMAVSGRPGGTDYWQQLDPPGLAIVAAAKRRMGRNDEVAVAVSSDVRPGVGLGGSGAFSVTALAALGGSISTIAERERLGLEASMIEIEDLGRQVGHQDHIVSAVGGLLNLTFDVTGKISVERLPVSDDIRAFVRDRLLLFRCSPVHRDAGDVLTEQAARTRASDGRTLDALDGMRDAARLLRDALRHGEIEAVAEALSTAWTSKRQLAPPGTYAELDEIYAAALRGGARGGRLVGAGGSGFILVEVPSRDTAQSVRAQMRALELPELIFGLDERGVSVIA